MTHLRRWMIAAIATLSAGLTAPAHATPGQSVRSEMPVVKFDREDQALMKARVNEALRAGNDGDTLHWKGRTVASGSVTPLDRFVADGLPCRRLRIENAYGDLKAAGVYKFCEKPAGQWKLVGPDR